MKDCFTRRYLYCSYSARPSNANLFLVLQRPSSFLSPSSWWQGNLELRVRCKMHKSGVPSEN
jgi:hypothetical protein